MVTTGSVPRLWVPGITASRRRKEGHVMQKKLTAVALAGAVALGGAAIAVPAFADTDSSSSSADTNPQARRVSAIKEALKGLVDDKTLTQEQADKVADTLGTPGALGNRGDGGPGRAGGPGGFGMRPGPGMADTMQAEVEAAAKVLGMSVSDLRAALQEGTTLAELARKQGKSEDELIDALVAVAKTRLAEAVKAKRITQERADEIEANLPDQVRAIVEHGRRGMGPGGQGGPGGHAGTGKRQGMGIPGPSSSPSATGSASGSSTVYSTSTI
jgi:hypothetical protein